MQNYFVKQISVKKKNLYCVVILEICYLVRDKHILIKIEFVKIQCHFNQLTWDVLE